MLAVDWIFKFTTVNSFRRLSLATSKVVEFSIEKKVVKKDWGNLSQKVGDKTGSC
jgi:hypothetical protein